MNKLDILINAEQWYEKQIDTKKKELADLTEKLNREKREREDYINLKKKELEEVREEIKKLKEVMGASSGETK